MAKIVMKYKIWDQGVIFSHEQPFYTICIRLMQKARNGNEIMLTEKDGLNLLSFL